MLVQLFHEYQETRKDRAMTVPGFIGFICKEQPKWYKEAGRRDIKAHPDFEMICDIIHGHVSDGLVDGEFKGDLYLKNFHNWTDKKSDSEAAPTLPTVVNIVLDTKGSSE